MSRKHLTGFIEPVIHTIRDQRVMLDSDLARIYQVTTKRLNEQLGAIMTGSLRTLHFGLPLRSLQN